MDVYCTTAYFAGYYKDGPLYEPHMACLAFVKSIKGEHFRSRRVLGGRSMSPRRPENAYAVFGEWAASVLRNIPARIWLVPVPGSKLGLGFDPEDVGSTAHVLAKVAAKEMGGKAEVADVLRFVQPHQSAHEGNYQARNRHWLVSQMRVTLSPPTGGCMVLVDDVLTSGGHLLASRDVLLSASPGLNPIGLCAAHTVKTYVKQPFPYPEVVSLA